MQYTRIKDHKNKNNNYNNNQSNILNYKNKQQHSNKHPTSILYLLLAACCVQMISPQTAVQTQAADVDNRNINSNRNSNSNSDSDSNSDSKITNTNFGNAIYNIRHGRSRVRHSNDHRWSLQAASFNNATHDSDDDKSTATGYGNGNLVGNENVFLDTDADAADGQLFNDEYWRNTDANASSVPLSQRQAALSQDAANRRSIATTVRAPVTHRIRKLHKKKIMESIRKSEEEQGVKLPKNHRSLSKAEHMQGRHPATVDEREGEEWEQKKEKAKEIDNDYKEDVKEMDEDYYQNDVFLSTATSLMTTIVSKFVPYASEFDEELRDGGEELEEQTFVTSLQSEITTPTTTAATRPDELQQSVGVVGTNLKISNNNTKQTPVGTSYEHQKEEKQNISYKHSSIATLEAAAKPLEGVGEVKPIPLTTNKERSLNSADVDNYLDSETYTEQLLSNTSSETTPFRNAADDEPVESDSNDYDSFFPEASAFPDIQPQFLTASSTSNSLDRSFELKEINFNGVDEEAVEAQENSKETPEDSMDEGHPDGPDEYSVSSDDAAVTKAGDGNSEDDGDGDGDGEDMYETNKFLEGVVDAANEDEIYDWDEISRNNRRNLMRGRDVVTKFLQIVETQHSLGSNCEAGTSLNLGEGVVDRYAQDRFRVEAEVAVNRANMLTRIFKMTSPAVQASVNLLHTSVLSMVEFDDDIFAAGNCFDWNQHPSQPGLFCPFAYRLPPPHLGAIFAKDLATEYHYLGNTSEWFFQARKNAEKVIARSEQYLKAFHLYSNKTDERIEEITLAVKYEDGRWSKPYYDCGGGNIWMLTYTVPFFGYENGTYFFKGTSGIDIDLRRVDIDQCPQRNTPGTTQPLNIFAGTDKCKQRTTMCEALKGLGFRRGSYKCVCRKGYYFPDTVSMHKFFNGSWLEEEYEKLMLGKNSTYNIVAEYECLPCAEGCDSCEDGSPCIAALNWPMRTSILVLACTVIGLLPPAAWFTFRYQQVKVVRAASPALLRVIALGAFFIYCTTIVMYPNPNLYTCTARIWLREIGFSLTYGALMLKTWRISVIFRVRSAKAVKITDAALLKRLGIICGVIGTCLLVRTLVSPPDVVVGRTADDLKAFLCKTDWWDYTFTSMEVLFLAWGVRLCIMVRKAPSEFNESRFISMAIYNEFLLTCFLNVSMLFLQSPANPDLLYIIFFCHTQLTVTLLLGLIFGSKVYIVLRSGKSHHDSIGLGAKSSGTKFNFRPQVRTFANPSSVTTSTVQAGGVTTSEETKLSDQEALEEIRQLSVRLQRIQDMAPPKGVAVMTISSLLDGLKTPSGIMMVAAAAGSAGTLKHQQQQPQPPPASLPLFSLNNDLNTYNQLHVSHVQNNNNIRIGTTATAAAAACSQSGVAIKATTTEIPSGRLEKSVNTTLTGEKFQSENFQAHLICESCLESCKEHSKGTAANRKPSTPTLCQRLGSPQPEGSISFSNIKLECMCSQPDDLDRGSASAATPKSRRLHQRTAATNTPPSLYRRRSKTKASSSSCSLLEAHKSPVATTASCETQLRAADSGEIFQIICDNCRNKLSSKSGSGNAKKFNKMAATQKAFKSNTTNSKSRSNVKQRVAAATAAASISQTTSCGDSAKKKVRSTDDIAFCTTTDDDDEDDSADSSDNNESSTIGTTFIRSHRYSPHRHELISQSTSALGNSFALACLADFGAPSTSSSTATGLSAAPATVAHDVVVVGGGGRGAPAHSEGNVSTNSIGSPNGKAAPSNGRRAKRPDKLMLDLNDRSKYTKEVSV